MLEQAPNAANRALNIWEQQEPAVKTFVAQNWPHGNIGKYYKSGHFLLENVTFLAYHWNKNNSTEYFHSTAKLSRLFVTVLCELFKLNIVDP